MNLADAPSRQIDIDQEMCIMPAFLAQIENRFRTYITYDACASAGTRIVRLCGEKIPYCSQYQDDECSAVNFFNLNFTTLMEEKLWIFCPRSQEAAFLDFFLQQPIRPEAIVILLQHQELPPLINLMLRHTTEFQIYRGRNLFRKPFNKRSCFVPYFGRLIVHCFRLPKLHRTEPVT